MAKKAKKKTVGKPAAKKTVARKRMKKSVAPKAGAHSTQHAVEQFLYRQAEILDAKRWEEYIDLFSNDGVYWMPADPADKHWDGIPSIFAEFINVVFLTHWGHLISLVGMMKNITAGLFGTFDRVADIARITDFNDNVIREIQVLEPPLWCSWAALFVICAICLALLSWRVKAYEVVR